MRHLLNNAARCWRIRTSDRLVQLCDAETLDDILLLLRVPDHAPVILDLDLSAFGCFCFLCHDSFEFTEFLESIEFVEHKISINSTNS